MKSDTKLSRTTTTSHLTLGAQAFQGLLLISVVHRFLAARFLRTIDPPWSTDIFRQWIVGIWGDVWISFLLAAPFLVIVTVMPPPTRTRVQPTIKMLAILWMLLWTVLTAAHQGYVEYFRQQIIPFHLEYLFDRSFLTANNETLFATRSLVILVSGILMCAVLKKNSNSAHEHLRQVRGQFLVLLIMAGLCHMANIRWRIQWFVPEALQTHYLERLFSNLKTKRAPLKLSAEDRSIFAAVKPPALVPQPVELIKKQLDTIKNSHHTAMIAVILAESLRPADIGWTRTESDPVSITPNLDALIAKGVNFTNAYSTGPVTRGGQEAVWCGTPSATDTSLMRSFPQFKISCLSDLASANQAIQTFWMHGGDARFDSQLDFWRQHGVKQVLTHEDFSKDVPQTGWGISDLAFFNAAGSRLDRFVKMNEPPHDKVILPMILSVTNHIPWDLPSDTPDSILSLKTEHPSHLTTAYFDAALGNFVSKLKTENLWRNSVIIVVSDHGGLEVTRNHSYKKDNPLKWEHLASHINLTLTGGIVEDLQTAGTLPHTIATFVSQEQVAPFIADLAGMDRSGFMDAPLFSDHSPWPIAVDLNQYLFLPESGVKIAKEDVISENSVKFSGESKIAVLRYRSFLQTLYEFKP